jgi:uncharacterized protein YndB with AHSA1/START domain
MNTDPDPHDCVMIERSFAAPISLLWKMWTDPEHFKAWYGPHGASIPVARFDLRVGGERFVGMEMTTPNGPMRMWFTGEHVEITEPRRLAYTEAMSDEHGNVQSPTDMGMPEGHPGNTRVRVELGELDGRTQVRLTHEGIPGDSPGAMGWNMALDKLATYVSQQP